MAIPEPVHSAAVTATSRPSDRRRAVPDDRPPREPPVGTATCAAAGHDPSDPGAAQRPVGGTVRLSRTPADQVSRWQTRVPLVARSHASGRGTVGPRSVGADRLRTALSRVRRTTTIKSPLLCQAERGDVASAPVLRPKYDAHQPAHGRPDVERDDLQRLLGEHADAWNSHDLDRLMTLFADDCVFQASGEPEFDGRRFDGRAQVRAAFAGVLDAMPDSELGRCSPLRHLQRVRRLRVEIDGHDGQWSSHRRPRL